MSIADKYVGVVVLASPSAVAAKASAMGDSAHSGAIFVNCQELGYVAGDMLYCRYGLSIPYYQVQVGDKVWIEPTVRGKERWVYTGLCDAGGESPSDADQLVLKSLSQYIYLATAGTMHLSSKTAAEAYVKGTTFNPEYVKIVNMLTALQAAINSWSPDPGDGGTALKTALASFLALLPPVDPGIVSTKIFGE